MTAAANPILGDIQTFGTALSDIKKLVTDVRAGTAGLPETLTALDATLKAVAIFCPPVAQAEGYVEAAEGVAALAVEFGVIKVEHGPLKPIFGGEQLPETVFGNVIASGGIFNE